MPTQKVRFAIAAMAFTTACSPPDPSRDVVAADAFDAVSDSAIDVESAPDTTDVPLDAGIVGARPFRLVTPVHYDPSQPTPLVILLHGFTVSGAAQEVYFRITPVAHQRTFLYAYPDGTPDLSGRRFWNATDACCNFDHLPVDDVAYVNAIVDDVSARRNVDMHRIYLVGHSNGGFMSHRLACESSSRFAAIVTLAGVNWFDMTRCAPGNPVSILQVHGDADPEIVYGGGSTFGVQYPSALATALGWTMRNHCTGTLRDTGMTLDLDTSLAGAETTLFASDGCPSGGAVELWTIRGGSHIPALSPTWATTIYDWLSAHPKP